jgi:hypothetical protein
MSFLLLFISSLQQNWRKEQNGSSLEVRGTGGGEKEGRGHGGEMTHTMYGCMNK